MPYLWIWLIIAPPVLVLIDLMASPSSTRLGSRYSDPGRVRTEPASPY